MKRQIILLTLLVLLSLQASSKISLGLNGGMIYNAPPFATNERMFGADLYNNRKGKTAAVIGAKFLIDLPVFQFGVGVRFGKSGFSYNQEYTSKPGTSTYSNKAGLISEYSSEGRFIMPYLFANYRIRLPKSYLYFGLNAGYIKYGDRTTIFTMFPGLQIPQYVSTSYQLGEHTKGMLSGGLQAGYTFNVTDQLGLQVESGVNYTQVEAPMPLIDVNAQSLGSGFKSAYLQIPFTVGVVSSF